jgi:hypothetical protein
MPKAIHTKDKMLKQAHTKSAVSKTGFRVRPLKQALNGFIRNL